MAICSYCGKEFDPGYARRSIGQRYGSGVYQDYYPDGDVCDDCALSEIGADYATGNEDIDNLMGPGYDPDC